VFQVINIFVFVTFLLASCNIFGQQITGIQQDETLVLFKKNKNPKLATILSTVIPGSGQIYNEKYWKFPVIYGGFAGLGYFADINNNYYKKYREAYEDKIKYIKDPEGKEDPFPGVAAQAIQRERERWRRNRDLLLIGIGLLYLLNILDANVDANLFDYDVSEDLTIKICPEFNNVGKSPTFTSVPNFYGIGLSYKF